MEVTHPAIVEMRRQILLSPSGGMTLHNQRVRLSADMRGTRFLARSIGQQIVGIDGLRAHPTLKVETFSGVVVARGYPEGRDTSGDPDIGYWLLPRLGFESSFPASRELLAGAFRSACRP